MRNEKFTAHLELGLELARSSGWEKEIKAKESLAWELHEQFPPAGSLLLGHVIWDQGCSYLKREVGGREFARTLVAESFKAVQELKEQDGWDYYYLGQSFICGRGTSQNYALAAEAFTNAWHAGNPYAEFEAIWARFLAGGTRLEAILALMNLRGKLADFAAFSARALTLLEIGPSAEAGSSLQITRLLLLEQALTEFIFHTQGARLINVAIEKELREAVVGLRQLDSPRSSLALYLIARASRSNPTGRPPLDWFGDAIQPDSAELEMLCRAGKLGLEEIQQIVERAKSGGWADAPLALAAASQLEEDCD